MATFAIDKDVPVPSSTNGGRPTKYPLGELEVGDSFFVPDVVVGPISGASSAFGRKHNKKFVTRTVDGGVRVWRIA